MWGVGLAEKRVTMAPQWTVLGPKFILHFVCVRFSVSVVMGEIFDKVSRMFAWDRGSAYAGSEPTSAVVR